MADILYNTAGGELWGATPALDLLSDTIKMMLLDNATYTENRDDDVVDGGGASDPADAEVSGTGYAGGYGGAGRLTLASKTVTVDKANDRSAFDAADLTWSGIDVGDVGAAAVVKEDHVGVAGNDTETRLISHHDTNFPVTTNGGDLTVQTPNDIIRLSTV